MRTRIGRKKKLPQKRLCVGEKEVMGNRENWMDLDGEIVFMEYLK